MMNVRLIEAKKVKAIMKTRRSFRSACPRSRGSSWLVSVDVSPSRSSAGSRDTARMVAGWRWALVAVGALLLARSGRAPLSSTWNSKDGFKCRGRTSRSPSSPSSRSSPSPHFRARASQLRLDAHGHGCK
jgi:hypothetical protein